MSGATALKKREPEIDALSRVNNALRGPVMDILSKNVPAFRGLPGEKIYELIMNNPELADHCLRFFRKNPKLFDSMLMDGEDHPVTRDDQPLSCGRTLGEVISLVVRAVAKRHFRSRLGPLPKLVPVKPKPAPSPWRRLLRMFGLAPSAPPPPPQPSRGPAKLTKADLLYRTIRDFLLYDWQLALIPHYVPVPVPVLMLLGPRILDFREAAQLIHLAENGLPELQETCTAHPIEDDDALWSMAQELKLPQGLKIEEAEMRQTFNHIGKISPLVVTALEGVGLTSREMLVLFSVMDHQLGPAWLSEKFCASVDPTLLKALTRHLGKLDLPSQQDPNALRECALRLVDDMRAIGYIKA